MIRLPIALAALCLSVSAFAADPFDDKFRQLDELLKQTWSKEDELRRAKADLAKLDRKINAEMNGKKSNDGSEGNTSDGGLKQAA